MFSAHSILPPASRPVSQPVAPSSASAPGENPYFPLPRDCKRILIFSNIRNGFPMPVLQDGDCVVHLNRATHFDAAREASNGRKNVSHFLFVRNAALGNFFWPDALEGFEAACTIRSNMYRDLPFFAEYRKAGGKNPTSGFIVAHILRHFHPTLPILLIGFAPTLDLSYRAPIHQWDVEAEWYAQGKGNFLIVPPAHCLPADLEPAPTFLHLLVCSCSGHESQRAACRETWLSNLPAGVTYQFFVGGDTPPTDEPDVLFLPGVDDSFVALPSKVLAAFRAASNNPTWNWIGKIDDDSYLRVDRLLPWLRPPAAIVGRRRPANYCPGGAGYFMRRDVIVSLLANADDIPAHGPEDKLICQRAYDLGYPITDNPLLLQYRKEGIVDPANPIVSSHHIDPELMRRIASNFAKAPTFAVNPKPSQKANAIHQIWIGGPLPPKMLPWTETIRNAARRAGWAYTLWDWPALLERFASDPATPLLRRIVDLAPCPQVFGILCDYFRFALLAQPAPAGVFYLDTDFSLAGPWPSFPPDALYLMVDLEDISKRCPGALWRPAGSPPQPLADACATMARRLDSLFKDAKTREEVIAVCDSVRVPRIIGPMFQRATVYRDWDKQRVPTRVFNPTFVAHSAWRTPATFTHHSLATWQPPKPAKA